jgi:hypothetical protein
MAKFRASKGFQFSEDGINLWADFRRVPGSDPAVYEFETSDKKAIDRLEKVDGVESVDEKPKRSTSRAKADTKADDAEAEGAEG